MASLSCGVVTSLTVTRQAIFVNSRPPKDLELKSMPFISVTLWQVMPGQGWKRIITRGEMDGKKERVLGSAVVAMGAVIYGLCPVPRRL